MFIIRLKSTLHFLFNLFIFLICILLVIVLFKIDFPSIVYADSGQSVMEMDGWTSDPNLKPLKPFPW
jgi:hypothetical protein